MPLPFLAAPLVVKGLIALGSAVAAGSGVAIYKNNKHNKARKEWQDEKRKLQDKIEKCQEDIVAKQKKISQLQDKLKVKDEEKLRLTKELHECDRMIDELERKQREQESAIKMIIALITFRYPAFKKESINIKTLLQTNADEKDKALLKIADTEKLQLTWQNEIEDIEREVVYLECELTDKEELLSQCG